MQQPYATQLPTVKQQRRWCNLGALDAGRHFETVGCLVCATVIPAAYRLYTLSQKMPGSGKSVHGQRRRTQALRAPYGRSFSGAFGKRAQSTTVPVISRRGKRAAASLSSSTGGSWFALRLRVQGDISTADGQWPRANTKARTQDHGTIMMILGGDGDKPARSGAWPLCLTHDS